MSVDEARRLALHDAAAHNRWTPETAVTLMELLPPSGWGDVVRRSDLDALEHRMDLRFQLVDQRFGAIDQRLDGIDQRLGAIDPRLDGIEKRLSDQITSVTTQLEKRLSDQITGVEARLELRIDARVEGALNRSIRWNVGTMIALAGVATAVARFG